MFRTLAFAATTGAIVAAPAFAGSPAPAPIEPAPIAPAPIITPASDWTGGYGGVQLGYGDFDLGGASGDGLVGGVQLGYDYDFGSWVLGGEFDYTGADVSVGGADVDSVMRVKARLGYDAGRTLIYATAGGARADTSLGDDTGWVAGVGAEYKVMENVSVGGEYLYHKFDDFNGTGSDLEANTFSAKVNYRF
ncbi:outer membrane protein [Pseudooceanicola sp. LIPI14-2-Ac024]|uniref:outer membrane protein n=1 Tax=Pseudooceanicola sp. LIPI14-2-Ac024 TaxID=3344875 RepID=UPI0035CEC791